MTSLRSLNPSELAVFFSAISICISVASVLIALWNFRREQLNQRITAAKWKREFFIDLLKWSDESILLLSESHHLCDLYAAHKEESRLCETQHLLRIKLSAQIDRGRWFFPNYSPEKYGHHKPPAYRGYRPTVLDSLVLTYDAVTSFNSNEIGQIPTARKHIEQARRKFTSEVQKVLNPRSRDEEFKKLIASVDKS